MARSYYHLHQKYECIANFIGATCFLALLLSIALQLPPSRVTADLFSSPNHFMVRVDDGMFESSQARALEYIVAGDTKSAITLVSSSYIVSTFPRRFS